MDLDWNALSVVPNRNLVLLRDDLNGDFALLPIPLIIIRGIHENFVEDLVEPGHVAHRALNEFLTAACENPEAVLLEFDASDVGVRAEKDVLELGLLLIYFLQLTLR